MNDIDIQNIKKILEYRQYTARGVELIEGGWMDMCDIDILSDEELQDIIDKHESNKTTKE